MRLPWTRNRLAAVDATTGSATAWDPNLNSIVNALAVSGSTVYVGGGFNNVGGATRSRLAAVDATTGSATAWNPNASGAVYALAVSGSTVYVGGTFITVGGAIRNRLAAVGTDGTLSTTWNPNASNTVYALAVSGSTVYAGGSFATIANERLSSSPLSNLAYLSPVASGPTVSSIAPSGSPAANAASVNFTVTFSEAVTGVDASDFTLTKTSTADGSIGVVTGSGTTWTVPVSSISGTGTLRLDLNGRFYHRHGAYRGYGCSDHYRCQRPQ